MTNYKENLAMALDTILAHKFRSFLTVLGIIVGIVTVVLISSLLSGARNELVTQVEDYGINNIFAFHIDMGPSRGRRSAEERKRKPLTVADARAIREVCPSVQDVSWREMAFGGRINISYKGSTLRSMEFMGTPFNYGTVANIKLENGRFFTASEDARRMSVAVVGPDAAEAMFGEADPVGKEIMINDRLFRVLGVTEKSKTSMIGGEGDNTVIIPYRTFQKLLPGNDMRILFIQAKSGLRDKALGEVESLLRVRRQVKPSEDNNFSLTTSDRFIEEFDSMTGVVAIGVVAISSIGLLVGGIGVMNIMLVSVTERTREIGVRKAIGATRKDIVLQFLLEAMTLTGVGGVLGIILALAGSLLIKVFAPSLPSLIPVWSVIAALTVSVGIGLVFGVWPARKAALLDPIEALRYE
ncbi:MAG: ABC transporter permease [Acidobacteria bacterium]|nr:ABC transporter permease [Acidobacteriota bacterium]